MTYFSFLLKGLLKNKLNYIPIGIPLAILIFLFVMNRGTLQSASFIPSIEEDNQVMNQIFTDYQEMLKDDLKADDRAALEEASVALQENINKNKQSILYARRGNWRDALSIQLEIVQENQIKDIESGRIDPQYDFVQSVYTKEAVYKKLKELNLEPEVDGIEKKGSTFTFRMMDLLFPVIFVFCVIAILSSLFCSSFVDKINTELMYPNYMKRMVTKFLFGVLISISIYLFLLLCGYLLSGLINGFSTFDYPIPYLTESFKITKNVGNLIGVTLLLQLSAIVLLVAFVDCVAAMTKNQLSTMFISSISLVGLILLTGNIAPLSKVLHLFPTTYFQAARVVTNQLAFDNNNPQINTGVGLIVLWMSNLIILVTIYQIKKREQNMKVLTGSKK